MLEWGRSGRSDNFAGAFSRPPWRQASCHFVLRWLRRMPSGWASREVRRLPVFNSPPTTSFQQQHSPHSCAARRRNGDFRADARLLRIGEIRVRIYT